MDFLRSFKTGVFLIFLCFSSGLGMESQPLTVDSINAIKFKLAKYFVNVKTAENELLHDGVGTALGVQALLDMLNSPVNLAILKERQAILKELVDLKIRDFDSLNISLKKMTVIVNEYLSLVSEINKINEDLKVIQADLWSRPKMDLRMVFTASIALPVLYSMWGSMSGEYFSAYVGTSMLFGAMDQYFLNSVISSYSTFGYIFSAVVGKLCKGKDLLLSSGNSVFTMNDQQISTLLAANACPSGDLLTCSGDSCYCIGNTGVKTVVSGASQSSALDISGYIPSFIKSFSSFISQANSSLLVGNALLHITTFNKYIAYKKNQSILASKKRLMGELLNQFTLSLDSLLDLITAKKLKLSCFKVDAQVGLNVKVNSFANLDLLIGLASLIRESNRIENGLVNMGFGFVNFYESSQNKDRFVIDIEDACLFLNLNSDKAYKALDCYSDDYILQKLKFVVTEDNKFSIESSQSINFLNIYAQMLLAHTFGIVWGHCAQMKFIDMNKILFVSGANKEIAQIIFPH